MIVIRRVKTDEEAYYTFVEQLMHTAFPKKERRCIQQQRDYSDYNPLFCNNIVLENKVPIGMISYWAMDGFFYIEHFAIDPSLRNSGYGRRVLDTLKAQMPLPIVLEVELPTNEMSIRRINFYKRAGFELCEKSYMQPPYHKGDSYLPMLLMTSSHIDMDIHFERIRNILYKEVYGLTI